MGIAGRDIVCLSTQYWDETWFRKQQFLSRFARTNRVLYVEPSFSMVRKPEAHLLDRGIATNRPIHGTLEARSERLFLLKPPRGLPKWESSAHQPLDARLVRACGAWALQRLGFSDSILWVYAPAYFHSIDIIPHKQLVFDLVDDVAGYGGEDYPHRGYAEDCVRGLVHRSDLFVVTALTLLERYGFLARHATHVANGFDATLLASARGLPPAMAGMSRPVLGFVGTLFAHLDFDILEEVARVHCDKSLVLVGPLESTARHALERLMRLPNVHYFGNQPRESIAGFISAFDVCLNPFVASRVTESVNPLKVYEYLALGRPVVSTRMRALELESVAGVIHFADDARQFCAQIDRCLSSQVRETSRLRRRAVTAYSWDALFARLEAACVEALDLGAPLDDPRAK